MCRGLHNLQGCVDLRCLEGCSSMECDLQFRVWHHREDVFQFFWAYVLHHEGQDGKCVQGISCEFQRRTRIRVGISYFLTTETIQLFQMHMLYNIQCGMELHVAHQTLNDTHLL